MRARETTHSKHGAWHASLQRLQTGCTSLSQPIKNKASRDPCEGLFFEGSVGNANRRDFVGKAPRSVEWITALHGPDLCNLGFENKLTTTMESEQESFELPTLT